MGTKIAKAILATIISVALSTATFSAGGSSVSLDGVQLGMTRQEVREIQAQSGFYPLPSDGDVEVYTLGGHSSGTRWGPQIKYGPAATVEEVIGTELRLPGLELKPKAPLNVIPEELGAELTPGESPKDKDYKYFVNAELHLASKVWLLEEARFSHKFRICADLKRLSEPF